MGDIIYACFSEFATIKNPILSRLLFFLKSPQRVKVAFAEIKVLFARNVMLILLVLMVLKWFVSEGKQSS